MAKYQYPFMGTWKITCPFGKIGAWLAGWHIGVDVVGISDRNIYPITTGIVADINAHGSSYGKHVLLKQDDGYYSLYAHLQSISVKIGQRVHLQTKLGVMGDTGNANGAHLHLELHKGSYRYPRGFAPKTAPWLVDPAAFIEDHIGVEDMENVFYKDLQVMVKGKPVIVKAVNADGSNYVLLRDLPKLLPPLIIGYDAENDRPTID